MKKCILVVFCLVSLFTVGIAEGPRVGIDVVAGGVSTALVGVNTSAYELGIGYSSQSNDASSKTEANVITFKGFLKDTLSKSVSLVYGAYYQLLSGKVSGTSIDSASAIMAVIGVEYGLTDDLLLTVQYSPFASVSSKVSGTTTNTSSLGSWVVVGGKYLL